MKDAWETGQIENEITNSTSLNPKCTFHHGKMAPQKGVAQALA